MSNPNDAAASDMNGAVDEVIAVRDIASQHGKRKQTVFKVLKRLGIETTKQRAAHGRNQLVAYITREDYLRVQVELDTIGTRDESEDDAEVGANEVGVFYFIQLEPVFDPGRFKVGFALGMAERLRHTVVSEINRGLDGRINSMTLTATPSGVEASAPGPTNLIGAIWLQFAEAVSGGYELRPCQNKACGKVFTVSADGRQSRKAFCSVACKVTDSRRREAKAIRLANRKTKLTEIAKQTGAKLETVRGWIERLKTTHPKGKR
jgi:hypothetical protein